MKILIPLLALATLSCGRRVERSWFDARPPAQPVQLAARPLPPSAFHVQWSPVAFPSEMQPGQWHAADVTFTNISDTVWPDPRMAEPLASGAWAVRLGYSWLDKPGALPKRSSHRTDLAKPLAPRESVTLPISVRAPGEPGAYQLRFELVQENVAWFADVGAEALTIPVRVRAASTASPAPRK